MKNIFLLLALIPGIVFGQASSVTTLTKKDVPPVIERSDLDIHFQVDRMGSPNEY